MVSDMKLCNLFFQNLWDLGFKKNGEKYGTLWIQVAARNALRVQFGG